MTDLETTRGMDALFLLRGNRQPPEKVVIVAIDEQSKREYGIGADFTQWRGKHTERGTGFATPFQTFCLCRYS